MKKDVLFTVPSYFRDDMDILGYRFGKGEKTCVVLGALRGGYLGYAAFRPYAGTGHASAGVRLVIEYAFGPLGLHRLEANIQPGNEPSKRLARRLGFRLEGFSPDYLFIDGAWRDHERWAITAPDGVDRAPGR